MVVYTNGQGKIGRKLYFQLISEMEVGSLTQREGERLRGRRER